MRLSVCLYLLPHARHAYSWIPRRRHRHRHPREDVGEEDRVGVGVGVRVGAVECQLIRVQTRAYTQTYSPGGIAGRGQRMFWDECTRAEHTCLFTYSYLSNSKQENSAGAQIARHASCWMPPKCKTSHFAYLSNLPQYNPRWQDNTIRVGLGMQVVKTRSCPVMCPFTLFCTVSSSFNDVTDGQTDSQTDVCS